MSADSFLDTNLFIYQLEARDTHKAEIAGRIIRDAVENGTGCISFQVVQECLNVAVRKAEVPLDASSARDYLDNVLDPLWQVMPTPALYHRALDIQGRYGYAFYDALIIAAAVESGCRRILTEDLHDGQRIDGVTIENPFEG